MERDRVQRYARSLERTIENNHHYLKEAIEDFRGLCLLVTPERNVPPEIIIDIREMYKEIRNRLTEIKASNRSSKGNTDSIITGILSATKRSWNFGSSLRMATPNLNTP